MSAALLRIPSMGACDDVTAAVASSLSCNMIVAQLLLHQRLEDSMSRVTSHFVCETTQ